MDRFSKWSRGVHHHVPRSRGEVAFQESLELRNDAGAQAEHRPGAAVCAQPQPNPLLQFCASSPPPRSLDVPNGWHGMGRIANARREGRNEQGGGEFPPSASAKDGTACTATCLNSPGLPGAALSKKKIFPVERILKLHASVDKGVRGNPEALLEEQNQGAGKEGRMLLVTPARD
ncbi:MAG: hypothetical protein CM15mP18_1170 [Methanobacteriota archaeon]|nr:MAG: hypothetical protein CM15mP18_1170 [Euryarchaeota archaeon]